MMDHRLLNLKEGFADEVNHLRPDHEILLLVDKKVIELLELLVQDGGKPRIVSGGQGPGGASGGARRPLRLRRPRQVFDELLEELVGEELVPPLRQCLLEVPPEILPKFHVFLPHSVMGFLIRRELLREDDYRDCFDVGFAFDRPTTPSEMVDCCRGDYAQEDLTRVVQAWPICRIQRRRRPYLGSPH
ncbi:hypothetical protein B296_00037979, partial [Ensete ventricosum]